MALILNIDTATENASLALSKDDKLLELLKNPDQKDHAAWIHLAISSLMKKAGYSLSALNGIAVTAGPGSYTGLRVGMATAKGLCYVLKIPLIAESTLKVMAHSALQQLPDLISANGDGEILLVPMVDARRMEVFAAVYDRQLNPMVPPSAMILTDESFRDFGGNNQLIFFGSGSTKFQKLGTNENFVFAEVTHDAGSLSYLSGKRFDKGDFADLAYAEPIYLKEFYTPPKK